MQRSRFHQKPPQAELFSTTAARRRVLGISGMEKIEQIVRSTVLNARRRIPVAALEQKVARATGTQRSIVKQAIKQLVDCEALVYTYAYGMSFLEPSFACPVRLSSRVVIKPPNRQYKAGHKDVVIDLAAGAAFGNGAHPSTCLAIQALDEILTHGSPPRHDDSLRGLDVGTGSGVLAIALARLGVFDVLGVDMDPCALSEARRNVALNQLTGRITIADVRVEALTDQYSVILANLAYPTLVSMSPLISKKMENNAVLILSGFKVNVSKDLENAYMAHGLHAIMERTKQGWACLVLRRPEQLHNVMERSCA